MWWYKKTSRWEPSFGRMAGSDYFDSLHYGKFIFGAQAIFSQNYLYKPCIYGKNQTTFFGTA